MEKIIGAVLTAAVSILFLGGCSVNVPPDESEIRTQLMGEWVNWLGGEDSESIVYIFDEAEVNVQYFSNGVLTEQQNGAYSITETEYSRGSWTGTITAKLGENDCLITFRTDKDVSRFALGVSDDINSPGYAKRRS